MQQHETLKKSTWQEMFPKAFKLHLRWGGNVILAGAAAAESFFFIYFHGPFYSSSKKAQDTEEREKEGLSRQLNFPAFEVGRRIKYLPRSLSSPLLCV